MSAGIKYARKESQAELIRPNIFAYHDYRALLKDWLAYLKASQSSFSIRKLSKQVEIAVGYIPMVLSGSRKLSTSTLIRLAPALGLTNRERNFLEVLVLLGDAETQEERLVALERMKRFPLYRKNNINETEVLQYLTHWYYVAIREMAALPDFRPEPEWIRSRLKVKVELKEIDKALKFLVDHKYLELRPDGSVRPPEKTIDCLGGIYKIALTQMHREMLALAAKSIENTPSTERAILGHTFAVDEAKYEEAKRILNEAFEKVRDLSRGASSGKTVYHMEIVFFPLTKRSKE